MHTDCQATTENLRQAFYACVHTLQQKTYSGYNSQTTDDDPALDCVGNPRTHMRVGQSDFSYREGPLTYLQHALLGVLAASPEKARRLDAGVAYFFSNEVNQGIRVRSSFLELLLFQDLKKNSEGKEREDTDEAHVESEATGHSLSLSRSTREKAPLDMKTHALLLLVACSRSSVSFRVFFS